VQHVMGVNHVIWRSSQRIYWNTEIRWTKPLGLLSGHSTGKCGFPALDHPPMAREQVELKNADEVERDVDVRASRTTKLYKCSGRS